jgi:hypothetical protein
MGVDKPRSNEIVFNLKGYGRKDEVAMGCVSEGLNLRLRRRRLVPVRIESS